MARLKRISLPENSKFLRPIPPGKSNDPEFVAAFDQRTLAYDTFYAPDTGLITLICPSLKFMRRFIKNTTFRVDGQVVENVEVDLVSPRTGEIRFTSPTDDPQTLRLNHRSPPAMDVQVPIARTNHDKFEGKNALVAISKNNKLEWIRDWLAYYIAEHGADGVVLIDNGSTDYDIRTLRQAVISVPGLKAAEIISAPFPFGPKGTDRVAINAKFFHLSVLHIANRRFLSKANAILSVDIDELVTKPEDTTIFDAVKTTPRGFLSIPGDWRYAKRPVQPDTLLRHIDHVLKRRGEDEHMQPKWCADPSGPAKGAYWRVHGILGEDRFFDHPFHYLHCRHITTNWDYMRGFEPEENFEPAPEADRLNAVFRQMA